MDFVKSVNGYGKVGETGDPAIRRKRLLIVAVSGVLLLTLVIAAIVGVVAYNHNNDEDDETSRTTSTSSSPSSSSSSTPMMLSDSIKSVCCVTRFPDSCFYQLKKGVKNCNRAVEPEVLFKLSMEVAMNEITNLSKVPEKLIAKTNNVRENSPLLDCQSLYQDAIDRLSASISSVKQGEDGTDKSPSPSKIDDIKTWLSAALTDLQTCQDGLEETESPALEEIKKAMQNSTEFTSNSLAIVSKISSLHHRRRRLLGFGFGFGF